MSPAMMPGTPTPWSDKKSLQMQLQKLWDKGLLLQAHCQAIDLFPLRLSFKFPGSKDLADQFDAVRGWINGIQKLSGFRIVYKTVRHRIIGENSLPVEAWVDDIETAIALLNKKRESAAFAQLIARTRQRVPRLIPWLNQYPLTALSMANIWEKLLDFVCWRQQHANPNVYLRQVCLPGIDSKFIELHLGVLSQLLDLALAEDQIQPELTGIKQFEARYGFRGKPERIRFRLLDSHLALLPGIDNDISLTAGDFKTLDRHGEFIGHVKRVFITENEINFLAFPAQNSSLVIFGAGYGFDALAQAAWLSSVDIFYWGDIDTHGFAILDQLRGKFSHVRSVLMDERTLMAHREFWGVEKSPESRALQRLTTDEQALYQALIRNEHQIHLRLEQERIHFDYLIAALSAL